MKGLASFDGVDPITHLELTIKEQAIPEEAIDDGILCKRCGKNSVISYQIQVRSGDEGTNTFFRCTNKSCRNSYLRH